MYRRAVKGLYIDLEEIRRCNDLVTCGDLMRCNGIVECDDLMRCDDILTWDYLLTLTCDDLRGGRPDHGGTTKR